jgi:hypothetical protein
LGLEAAETTEATEATAECVTAAAKTALLHVLARTKALSGRLVEGRVHGLLCC